MEAICQPSSASVVEQNETRHSSLAFQFLPKFFGSCPSITGSTSSLAALLSEVMDRQPLKEALFRGSHRKCIRVTTNNQRFLHRPLLLGLFVARNRVERMEPHPSRNAAKKGCCFLNAFKVLVNSSLPSFSLFSPRAEDLLENCATESYERGRYSRYSENACTMLFSKARKWNWRQFWGEPKTNGLGDRIRKGH